MTAKWRLVMPGVWEGIPEKRGKASFSFSKNGVDMATYFELIKAAIAGCLPSDFDKWDLADPYGNNWTIAHEAALYGNLPVNFDQWDLADHYGRTVAHIAAYAGTLPANFDRWDLVDWYGWSVADEAILMDHKEAFVR